jgi:ABC-type antimicrobial peptide transport system permease subunit
MYRSDRKRRVSNSDEPPASVPKTLSTEFDSAVKKKSVGDHRSIVSEAMISAARISFRRSGRGLIIAVTRQSIGSIRVGPPPDQSEVAGSNVRQNDPRFLALILTVFSSLALVLAGFGVYGVVVYSVAQRTSEFGVRLALGAGRGDLLGQVLREGAFLGIVGAAAGRLGAAGVTRVLEGLLFEVGRFDFVTFATMAGILIVVSLFASWLPAVGFRGSASSRSSEPALKPQGQTTLEIRGKL